MQHLPNDTIDVLLDQFGQIETVNGDPNFPTATDTWGGNDSVTATITQPEAEVTIFGDDNTTLHGQSHGGNDTLTVNFNYGWNAALVVGDAQAMTDDARGGNDTIDVENTARCTPTCMLSAMSLATCRAVRTAAVTPSSARWVGETTTMCTPAMPAVP
ncbi:hypothetical protein ACVWW7_006768 [Bradyrhizobium sp. LM6.9]